LPIPAGPASVTRRGRSSRLVRANSLVSSSSSPARSTRGVRAAGSSALGPLALVRRATQAGAGAGSAPAGQRHERLAGVDPDPHARAVPGRVQLVDEGEGGPDGPLGVVIAGGRDAEHGQGRAPPGGRFDLAAVALDLAAQAAHALGCPLPGQGGDQDGDLLALLTGQGRACAGRQPGRLGPCGAARQVDGRVAGAYGLFEALQLGAGLDAQLPVQGEAGGLVDVEGVVEAAGPVEGEHELAAQPLAQGMDPDQRLQLAEELVVLAEGQAHLDRLLAGGVAQLAQAGRLDLGEIPGGQVGQRFSAPQAKGPVVPDRRPGRVVGPPGLRRPGHEALETLQVDVVGLGAQLVAVAAGDEPPAVLGQGPAEPVHEEVHALPGSCRGRRALVPEGVDDLFDGHDLVRAERQEGKQGTRGRAADLNGLAGSANLDGAEQAILHQGRRPFDR